MLPKLGVPETWFRAGQELNTFGLEHGHLSIGEWDEHSAAWLHHLDTRVQTRC